MSEKPTNVRTTQQKTQKTRKQHLFLFIMATGPLRSGSQIWTCEETIKRPWTKHPQQSKEKVYGTTNTVYGTTNADAGVGIGMKRGDSEI